MCYDPARLREPPYELVITSRAPFLGDKASMGRAGGEGQGSLAGWLECVVGACPATSPCHLPMLTPPLLSALHPSTRRPQGRFSSRTIVEPMGPGRCRHTLEQRIETKGMLGLGAVAKRLAK